MYRMGAEMGKGAGGRPWVGYPEGESNSYLKFRKLLFYPLNYRGVELGCSLCYLLLQKQL